MQCGFFRSSCAVTLCFLLAACSGSVEPHGQMGGAAGTATGGEGGTSFAAAGTNASGIGGSAGMTGGSNASGIGGMSGSSAGMTGGSGVTGGMTGGGPPQHGMLPLTDLAGGGTYMDFEGGLYPEGNEPPPAHRTAGIMAANTIAPLDAQGVPSASGKIVLLSIGMSNCTMEFCMASMMSGQCAPQSFMGQASADNSVDNSALVIVDGARGSQTAMTWASSDMPNYDLVRDERLQAAGVTEAQVQAIWVKNALPGPRVSLPNANADAYELEQQFGNVMRALAQRYPNLKQVFVSSRTFGGYATVPLNPEPYAFETGFAVKWLIEAQITQVASGSVDIESGNLDYRDDTAPWLAWGPYLWAAGTTPRSDGLTWEMTDFGSDGTHPNADGQRKVGELLLEHFKTSPFTRCWFLAAHPACE